MKNRLLQFVIWAHALLLALSFITYKSDFFPKKKQRLIVRSRVEPPPTVAKVATPQPKIVAVKSPPKPKPKPQPTKKSPPKPQVKAKAATPQKPRVSEEKKRVLADLQKSLQTIETKKPTLQSTKLELPDEIASLQIDREEPPPSNAEYGERLIAHLQQSLILPEVGEVKIKLTLDPDGKILHLDVLNCTSDVNKLYLEKELPRQIFPPLQQKKSESYILTFCNQDS